MGGGFLEVVENRIFHIVQCVMILCLVFELNFGCFILMERKFFCCLREV